MDFNMFYFFNLSTDTPAPPKPKLLDQLREAMRSRLRVQDIDLSRNEITVRDGKGAKDRITMLPESLKQPLCRHLAKAREIHETTMIYTHVLNKGGHGVRRPIDGL